jgi:hypothetical protein
MRDVGGTLHAECLVRPFGIELVHESVEAVLLLQAVGVSSVTTAPS